MCLEGEEDTEELCCHSPCFGVRHAYMHQLFLLLHKFSSPFNRPCHVQMPVMIDQRKEIMPTENENAQALIYLERTNQPRLQSTKHILDEMVSCVR